MTKTAKRKRIAAFGASRIAEDDARFADVETLSEKLGQAGYDGLVGGHQGMMAAFSQGVRKGGGHVTGVTLQVFPTPPQHSLSEEKRASDFFERMQMLIEEADAYLVLPGGLGTLAEFAMTWDLLAIRILEPRPLVVYGQCWQPMMDTMRKQLVMSVNHGFEMVCYCKTHDEVLAALTA